MAKKSRNHSPYWRLSLQVAAVLRKNPEMNLRQLRHKIYWGSNSDVRALWKSWNNKAHNKKRLIEFRCKGFSA